MPDSAATTRRVRNEPATAGTGVAASEVSTGAIPVFDALGAVIFSVTNVWLAKRTPHQKSAPDIKRAAAHFSGAKERGCETLLSDSSNPAGSCIPETAD